LNNAKEEVARVREALRRDKGHEGKRGNREMGCGTGRGDVEQ